MRHSQVMGGSSAIRRIRCPGSFLLEQQSPERPTSQYAEKGTALHEAIEYYLLHHDGESPRCLIGRKFNGYVIDQKLLDTKIQPALRALDEIIEMAGGEIALLVEAELSLMKYIRGAFGTIDILGLGVDDKLWLVDWKFGDYIRVRARVNSQLGFCAAAAFSDPSTNDWLRDVKHVVFCIVQPGQEKTWHYWETSRIWVEGFRETLITAAQRMQEPNGRLKSGSHCQFCRAVKICPQHQVTLVTGSGGLKKRRTRLRKGCLV